MRKVKMKVSWRVEEVIEITLTDVDLKNTPDDHIASEIACREILNGDIPGPCCGADYDRAEVADADADVDRKFSVEWGDLDGDDEPF
jgi:hypothetical protein